ncbi:MAG: hypothetical protein K8R60_24005 [Burkholderiales bacterium]|nr:hypothetical protein [Burkholderiales bacterium]
MPAPALKRLLSSYLPSAVQDGSAPRSESLPPLARVRHTAWIRRLGERSRGEALATARLDFDEALGDVRTARAIELRSRIAVARSLHELWHFREEVFSLVACRHDQARAAGRLAELDLHFPRRDRS